MLYNENLPLIKAIFFSNDFLLNIDCFDYFKVCFLAITFTYLLSLTNQRNIFFSNDFLIDIDRLIFQSVVSANHFYVRTLTHQSDQFFRDPIKS